MTLPVSPLCASAAHRSNRTLQERPRSQQLLPVTFQVVLLFRESRAVCQWVPNISAHQNHLVGLLNRRLLTPQPELWLSKSRLEPEHCMGECPGDAAAGVTSAGKLPVTGCPPSVKRVRGMSGWPGKKHSWFLFYPLQSPGLLFEGRRRKV